MTKLKSRLIPRYRFNPDLGTTGRYIDEKGRMVPLRDVNRQMERVIKGVQDEMIDVSRRLQRGEINTQRWYLEMRQRMKMLHSLSAVVAKGGWEQMTQSDWGAVGGITRFQYDRLANFAQEIADGKVALNGGFISRARMYALAARGTGEELNRRLNNEKPNTEERRVLGVADHCSTRGKKTGCIQWAAMGWQQPGVLGRIGDSPCLTFCHCKFIFREV